MENGDGRVKFGLLPPPTHPGPHAVSIFSPLILFCAPPTVPVSFAFCPSIFPISTNPFTSSNCFSIFQFFPISFHLQPTILRTLHNHFCYFLFSLFLLPCFFVFLFVFFFFSSSLSHYSSPSSSYNSDDPLRRVGESHSTANALESGTRIFS